MRMGHMVGAGWIDRPTVEGRLFKAAQACGLVKDDGQRSVLATIKSGLDAGEKEPHAPLSDRGNIAARTVALTPRPVMATKRRKTGRTGITNRNYKMA